MREVRVATWRPGMQKACTFSYFINPDYGVVRRKCRQLLEDVECYFPGLCANAQGPPRWIQPWQQQLELWPCEVWAERRCWNCSGWCWMFPEPNKEPLSRVKKSINRNDQACPGLPVGSGSTGQHWGARAPCACCLCCFSCECQTCSYPRKDPALLVDPRLLTPVLWRQDKGILDSYRNQGVIICLWEITCANRPYSYF